MIAEDGDGLVNILGIGDRSMQIVHYAAFGFLIACMI
jgi:hypothetical protein